MPANRPVTPDPSPPSEVTRPALAGGELARTGPTRLRPLSALGLGLILMGAGLLVMIRRPASTI
jgi:LPXTG-motif cell wall-anchored protein